MLTRYPDLRLLDHFSSWLTCLRRHFGKKKWGGVQAGILRRGWNGSIPVCGQENGEVGIGLNVPRELKALSDPPYKG